MKPWFRYRVNAGVFLIWWPCSWQGVLLLPAGMTAVLLSMATVMNLMMNPPLALVMGVAAAAAFVAIGWRHAEKSN